MLASDLMGLGVSPLLAARTASAGIGPVTITPAGATYAASTKIGASQYLVSTSNTTSMLALGLPQIGGDNGALLADDYVINNGSSVSLSIRVSTSVLISMFGVLSAVQFLNPHTTATFYPVLVPPAGGSTTANWIGIGGT